MEVRRRRLIRRGDYVPWAPVDYSGKGRVIRPVLTALMERRRIRASYQGLDDATPQDWVLEPSSANSCSLSW